ncbi:hypothetical protein OAF65_09415 [Verrucomicrobiales bacterium]|nr:hypothetical protein [Verrucomicrobiales bacterium]NCG26401.1 hypothetical protein [Verrucomicrobiales bacterium]|tara:strand:+ start:54 stop:530 length:477 start_codon:yes stop_codon:yes gene_type:complete
MKNKTYKHYSLSILLVMGIYLIFSQSESIAQIKANNKTISGSGQFGGASITTPKAAPIKKEVKKITYLAVTDDKTWINEEGKTIKGRLIAFNSGNKEKFIPPTIIKDNNVRMLIGNKAYVFPLEKLREENRKEILNLRNGFKAHYERVKEAQKKKDSQ